MLWHFDTGGKLRGCLKIVHERRGYIHRRHDRLRDLFAGILDSVTPLQPLSGEVFPRGANIENKARLDVAARGFWQECEMAFF